MPVRRTPTSAPRPACRAGALAVAALAGLLAAVPVWAQDSPAPAGAGLS